MELETGNIVSPRYDLRHPGEIAKQRNERRRHVEDDGRAGLGHQRDIAPALDGIPEALLMMKQDGLAGEVLFTEPERCRKIARARGELGGLPAPLVFRPAAREIAEQQA